MILIAALDQIDSFLLSLLPLDLIKLVGDSVKGLPSVAGSFIRHWHDDEGKEVYFYLSTPR